MKKLIYLLLFPLLSVLCFCSDQTVNNVNPGIDSLLKMAFIPEQAGAVVMIVKDSTVVFRKAYGKADIENNKNMTTDKIFGIGAIADQFTAVAILMLEKEEKLRLNDEISKYINDLPEYSKNITIENLLNHTSGLKNVAKLTSENQNNSKQNLTLKECIELLKSNNPDFAPGENSDYCNTGYFLLKAVIEKISGLSYNDFLLKNIFNPLQMNHTFFSNKDVKNLACGYLKEKDKIEKFSNENIDLTYNLDEIYSNIDDLAKWNNALQKGRLIKSNVLAKAFDKKLLNSGRFNKYGFGWEITNLYDMKCYVQNAKGSGYHCYTINMPDKNIYCVVLSNLLNEYDLNGLKNKIIGIMLDKPVEFMKLTVDELQKYVGSYKLGNGGYRYVYIENNQLVLFRSTSFPRKLVAINNDLFYHPETDVKYLFGRDKNGNVIQVYPAKEKNDIIAKTTDSIPEYKPLKLDDKTLTKYTGEYQYGFKIKKGNNCLLVYGQNNEKFGFYPVSETHFKSVESDIHAYFKLDDNKNVIGLEIMKNFIRKTGKGEVSKKTDSPVNGIDHLIFYVLNPPHLFNFLKNDLQLGSTDDYQARELYVEFCGRKYSTGYIDCGNLYIECSDFRENITSSSTIVGFALDPTNGTEPLTKELDKRKLSYKKPREVVFNKVKMFTITELPSLVPGSFVFTCEYHTGQQSQNAKLNNPLGIENVAEVKIMVKNKKESIANWAIFVAPIKISDDCIQFDRGPKIRFIEGKEDKIVSLCFKVKSLAKITQFLNDKKIIGNQTKNLVSTDAAKTYSVQFDFSE